MSQRTLARLAVSALALVGLLGGCGDDHDHAPQFRSCAEETRADLYVPGMTKTGTRGAMKAILVESEPGPPIRDDNTWTMEIRDAQGSPQAGLALKVSPHMRDHGHPTPKKVVVSDLGSGRYRLAPVNFFMKGLWTVDIEGNLAGGADVARFEFCVD